ncbi:uncharacterized protein BXZ73DRAFT_49641 [Epithele typhae]|uniref:uncharacterized protein n=1 Tax=Epithele typhae TaxID=378194 RepID=UPI002008965C|nr:uncharacterized protein BXZ73DRAFT_49641 [Epithele typhae]KAH9925934.1 hypothetical protein BXZ73DRAFT_49641 [Epithele typhae]
MPPATSRILLRELVPGPSRRASAYVLSMRNLSTCSSSRPAHSALPRSLPTLAPHTPRRTLATTAVRHAAVAQKLRSARTLVVAAPSQDALAQEEDEDEPDVELVSPGDVTIQLSDRAAEKLRAVAERDGAQAGLRLAVDSGGCHGYQYRMELAKRPQPDDYRLSHPRIQPSNVYVDAVSMTLVNGATVDYATELIGSSFRVLENPQAKGSGCGCGVSWELNV